MGSMISRFDEIERLRFEKFPTRPGKVEKIIRVGTLVVGVGKTGVIHTTCRASRNFAFAPGTWPWQEDLLTALVKLGVVDKSIADQHQEICRQRERRSHADHVLKHDVPELEKDFGVKLTAAQRRKIERVANPEVP